MTETNKNSGDKLSVSSTKTLTLKRSGVEQGVVRQSFSHGRSKSVVVEKVKRRTIGPAEPKADAGARRRAEGSRSARKERGGSRRRPGGQRGCTQARGRRVTPAFPGRN